MTAGTTPADASPRATPAQPMSDILFQYDRISPATWVYVSSLLTIALYFKFSRFWSVRNLDLVLLILLAPGLLMVIQGRKINGKMLWPRPAAPADLPLRRHA